MGDETHDLDAVAEWRTASRERSAHRSGAQTVACASTVFCALPLRDALENLLDELSGRIVACRMLRGNDPHAVPPKLCLDEPRLTRVPHESAPLDNKNLARRTFLGTEMLQHCLKAWPLVTTPAFGMIDKFVLDG
jgi:hypothetical protein